MKGPIAARTSKWGIYPSGKAGSITFSSISGEEMVFNRNSCVHRVMPFVLCQLGNEGASFFLFQGVRRLAVGGWALEKNRKGLKKEEKRIKRLKKSQ
jgi:hypothetical protein